MVISIERRTQMKMLQTHIFRQLQYYFGLESCSVEKIELQSEKHSTHFHLYNENEYLNWS